MSKENKKVQIRSALLLFVAALIWGTAFVAQSKGADHVGGFAFMGIRNIIGGVVLLPAIALFRAKGFDERPAEENHGTAAIVGKNPNHPIVTKTEMVAGIICGIFLAVAGSAQQIGIAYTTTAKAGFLTAMYVIIVPILGIFFRKHIKPIIWLCALISLAGLYLLCMTGSTGRFNGGDALEISCAFLFALQIISVGHFASRCSGTVLSCIEFFVAGIICLVLMAIFEKTTWSDVIAAAGPILYAGVLSSGVAYTLQVITQKNLNPTLASLIMCMESVVSAISGWIVLGQALSGREIMGCVLMFIAIVVATLRG